MPWSDALYLIGGHSEHTVSKMVFKLPMENENEKMATAQWSQISDMNESRVYFGVVTFQNQIFVFGGYDGEKVLQSTEVLNT